MDIANSEYGGGGGGQFKKSRLAVNYANASACVMRNALRSVPRSHVPFVKVYFEHFSEILLKINVREGLFSAILSMFC